MPKTHSKAATISTQPVGASSTSWNLWILLGAIALGAALRLPALDSVPPGINQDEAVHAYEAHCLRANGTDHDGTPWPFFFRCYGQSDHHSAPFIWLLVPLQALFGMNVWTTRLPPALLGTLNVWLVYELVRRVYNTRAGLIAALLLAVSPWHIHLSRLAFEVSICPTLITAAMLLLAIGTQAPSRVVSSRVRNKSGCSDHVNGNHSDRESTGKSNRPDTGRLCASGNSLTSVGALLLSGLLFGIALWTYNAMRVFVPLLLIGTGIIYFRRLRDLVRVSTGRRALLAGLCGFGIGIAPFVWASIKTPQEAWGRATFVSLMNASAGPADTAKRILTTYFMHFSPDYLFISGDPYNVQHLPEYGQLHHFYILLLPLGFVRVVRRWRTERFGRLTLWWILISAVPPALTVLTSGHALRSAGGLPAYDILAAMGAEMLLATQNQRRRIPRVAAGLIVANVAWFVYLFFIPYPGNAYPAFQSEWKEIVADVRQRESGYDLVLLTLNNTNQVGMLYLFWNNVDPKTYFEGPRHIAKGPEWDQVIRVGKTFFLPATYLEQLAPNLPAGARVLVGERPGFPVPGTELKRFHYPDGRLALILYEVVISR